MPEPRLELLQFPYSHYNEKARWALDVKRVPHARRSLLPGPHAPTILRLTGETTVPVMRFGDEIVAGSARIIDELERRFPEPALYPADAALRRRALEIQAWLDDDIGPRVRRGVFAALLQEPAYVCWTFSSERGAPVRALYRALFPLTKIVMKRSMGLTGPASVEDAHAGVKRALDFVASEAGPHGYLVGDAFTVADLTAASLLAPAVMPPDSPMALPLPRPVRVREWLARWATHPGTAWVRDQYRRHRPASAEGSGRAGGGARAQDRSGAIRQSA
jgi:glutathione S-transferase